MRLELPREWYEKNDLSANILDIAAGSRRLDPSPRYHSKVPKWTHQSVLKFAQNEDPIALMVSRARLMTLQAQDNGWAGPPFDPIQLAQLLNIVTAPKEEVTDARLIALPEDRIAIEYNPNRPRARTKFSVAHEIAHSFFPDWRQAVRNRLRHNEMRSDDWQLEMLCNIGASELLMPAGSLTGLDEEILSIDGIIGLQKEYEVSIEAVLLRAIQMTKGVCAIFTASHDFDQPVTRTYRINYFAPSRSWAEIIPRGYQIPKSSKVTECTAIGYTAKGEEKWPALKSKCRIECVGIPPFPGALYPRVAGVLIPESYVESPVKEVRYLVGDATSPRGQDHRMIVHVVNDKTPRWGGGFALAVRRKWQHVQEDFIRWTLENPSEFRLGNIHIFDITHNLSIAHMICQHGYGPSPQPRIRYMALEDCLRSLAAQALENDVSVHMPFIGAGQSGGSWDIVKELIDRNLCMKGVDVTVYKLPYAEDPPEPEQMILSL